MQIIWKDIEGYEGLYQVGSNGLVKSLERVVTNKRGEYLVSEKLLKIHPNPLGYMRVGLFKDGKRKYHGLHRLVAKAFIDNPYDLPEVNHINGIKSCNIVDNLEWVTKSQNVIHFHNHLRKNRNDTPIKDTPREDLNHDTDSRINHK